MQFSRNKTTATAIATFLVLTIAATLVALPTVNAHEPAWSYRIENYVSVTPVTIGVNQPVILVAWSNQMPVGVSGAYGQRYKFYIDVMKPDGTNDTLGPIKSDPVGSCWISYTPAQVGTYTIVSRFPPQSWDGLTYNAANAQGTRSTNINVNDTRWAWDSEPVQLTVQQEPMKPYQETPLPTGLWTRPVYGNNREWWSVMGQWLGGPTNPSRINDYSDGPESGHILWTRPVWLGGVMGGQIGDIGIQRQYYSGQSYEGYGSPGLCVEGKIFYSVGQPPAYGWYAVDLYTGKTVYYENNTDAHHAMPSLGQILNIDNPNQHGGFGYLWRTSGVSLEGNPGGVNGTVWELLDAYTGNMIGRIANVSTTGTQFMDKIGSICYVSIANIGNATNPNYRLRIWNTTHAIWINTTSSFGVTYWSWRPTGTGTHAGRTYGTGFDGQWGYSLNVSLPVWSNPTIRAVRAEEYIIGGSSGSNNGTYVVPGNMWKMSLKYGQEGTMLWNFTFTPPSSDGGNYSSSQGSIDPDAGVFYLEEVKNRTRWAYSMDKVLTGQDQGTLLWTSAKEGMWNFYGMSDTPYRGRLYSMGYSGVLLAYNATTGHIDWNWSAPYVGVDETPYPHTPLSFGCAADGKLYLYTSEHSVTSPIRRDAKIYCVDAETGKLYWAVSCWPSGAPIISDGRIIVYDILDGSIACYGQGNSKTTVSAPDTAPAIGSIVTIKGTVTDDTPTGRLNTNAPGKSIFGSTDPQEAMDYDFVLRGTPAVSDADMDAWMEYMFHQRPIPTNAKGVEVTLDAIDPNNNYIHIGTTTSDSASNFGLAWTPEVPGTYQVIATFAGSAAYGPSYSTTYLTVGPAPPEPTEPEPAPPLPPFEMYTLYATIAIIIAIAIVGLLILRKKP